MRSLRIALLFAALSFGASTAAHAAWPPSGFLVDSIRANSVIQPVHEPIPDGTGNLYLFAGKGYSMRLAHRVDADGNTLPGWPIAIPFGMPVADGAGGFVLCFTSGDGLYDLRALHYLADGGLDPSWPAGGTHVCDAAGTQYRPFACSDGSGGAFVVWEDTRDGSSYGSLYAHHVLASGALAPGPSAGVEIAGLGGELEPNQVVLARDGSGGFFVAWTPWGCGTNCAVHVQRVSAALAAQWDPGGRALPGGLGWWPNIVHDGTGGLFVAWEGNSQVRVWRLDPNGSPATGWPLQPFKPEGTHYQWSPTLLSDGAGGVLLGWNDGGGAARVLRLDGSSAIHAAWPAAGLVVSGTGGGAEVDLLPDGTGGALVSFSHYTGDGSTGSLRVQRVTGEGAIASGWDPEGIIVRPLTDEPHGSKLAPLGGQAVMTWWERRPVPATSDIHDHDDLVLAQRVTEPSPVGAEPSSPPSATLTLGAPAPNPTHGAFRVNVTIASDAAARLELVDVGGRRRQSRDVAAGAGAHSIEFGRGLELSPGLYFVRLRQGAETRVARVVVTN